MKQNFEKAMAEESPSLVKNIYRYQISETGK